MEDAALLSKAIEVWYDPDVPFPRPDDGRIVSQFGDQQAQMLIPQLNVLRKEFFASDADRNVPDLAEMANKAAADFRSKHPGMSAQAIKLLANDYAFSNR